MKFYLRRIIFGLGLMLMVVGWGATQYADARQQAIAADGSEAMTLWEGESTKPRSWLSKESFMANKTLMSGGVLCMAVGVVVVVVSFPRGSWHAGP